MIEPDPIAIPEAELDDLRGRLGRTRWPDAETVEDWSQGIPLAYMREVVRYWAEHYDWRRVEHRLNSCNPQRTVIDGLGIHFLHVPSSNPSALPLVLTHGWPGSVVEFLDAIGPLTEPQDHGGNPGDAFHVVCPALPGYGFSDKPSVAGWSVERIADAWSVLMQRLGYERYLAQGGDWGAMVTTLMGLRDPEHCAAIHLNMPIVQPDPATMEELTEAERAALEALQHYQSWDSGYARQQSTRPQTLGYALADSPAGQAAWILEKFHAWTDCGGHPENAIGRDALLDNVMMYWLTNSAASSARLYWESFHSINTDPVDIPVGCSIFPKEIFRCSRRWAEQRFSRLVHWRELDRGGHFAAFEQPALFVDELRACFGSLR